MTMGQWLADLHRYALLSSALYPSCGEIGYCVTVFESAACCVRFSVSPFYHPPVVVAVKWSLASHGSWHVCDCWLGCPIAPTHPPSRMFRRF